MTNLGILAYGSLIEDPGIEIEPLIVERRTGIETPFCIEFARSSTSRSNAPTVIPLVHGGSRVQATILVLHASVGLQFAEDLLWRRETRNETSEKHYVRPSRPDPNRVVVESLLDFSGIQVVIYTRLGPNIHNLSPTKLAELAVNSARAKAGKIGKDGISYLISLKNQGISTPLMPAYEREILRILNAVSLEDALGKCRSDDVRSQ
jgi:cation transport regulator ChaC